MGNKHESNGETAVNNESITSGTVVTNPSVSVPTSEIINIFKLLTDTTLRIPQYQRPYKWTVKNVNQLLTDIVFHKNENKKTYRLGTVVFQKDKEEVKEVKNIVDGQQRIISLMLVAHALIELKKSNHALSEIEVAMEQSISAQNFASTISQANIYKNYQEIERLVSQDSFTESHIDFFLHKCEVVTVTLTDISEAFQFFDSQNSRGRDLNPHDLLKAYHLREFGDHDKDQMPASVADWESRESQQLATLFGEYLYRIRRWSKGASAPAFTKADVDLFKGVNLDKPTQYPHVRQLQIVHHHVSHCNTQYEQEKNGYRTKFPFQIDQTIINGERFFEWVLHYQEMIASNSMEPLEAWLQNTGEAFNKNTLQIGKAIDSYNQGAGSGDKRVKMMFNCLLIYYIDKFGYTEISRAVEKIFVWAYALRLQNKRIGWVSVDNYVSKNNLFLKIKEAIHPAEFLNSILPLLSRQQDVNSTKKSKIEIRIENIKELFKEMNCYE